MDIELDKNFFVSRPFGPSIVKVKIPKEIIYKLNDYIDKIIIDNQKTNNLNLGHKLAGDVTQEFKLEQEFMTECGWLKFLGQCVQKERIF